MTVSRNIQPPNQELTQFRLRQLVHYDPETGVFKWRKATSNRVKAGGVAHSLCSNGYVRIGIDGRRYHAHRLAWLYVFGSWPAHQIDHLNGQRSDNRIANLRAVTRALNTQNQQRAHADSASGLLGVTYDKSRGKYQAKIYAEGRHRHLGRFATPEAAHAAYLKAKRTLHPGNTI